MKQTNQKTIELLVNLTQIKIEQATIEVQQTKQ